MLSGGSEGVELRVLSDSAAARELLQSQVETLRSRLAEAGLDLLGLHTDAPQADGRRRDSDAMPTAVNAGPEEAVENPTHAPAVSDASAGRLDLYA